MRLVGVVVVGVCASACASQELVHFGGTLNPAEPPGATMRCYGAREHMTIVDRPAPDFPEELAYFMYISQSSAPREILMRFDIAPDGTTRNIRYGGDVADLDHGATRDAVSPAARAIATWRYAWSDTAPSRYATGCETRFDFAMRG
ncbi:hypothetical protein [Maricaulis sp.]|uniref:hypothetical protein n=1 Tax=Maricaulis sp. TaxID=1486257 RepID=UPI002B279869|nr:hypothetical protein [Maricaulis sp.]